MTRLLRRLSASGWRFVREVTGDDAYERYLAHQQRAHPDELPMSRDQYYRFRLDQKWSKVSRCC
jgi:uncharacterized short protein YbdD (DUF466 family)